MYQFSDQLKNAMALRDVSQKYVADAAKTTEATISRYASGKSTPPTLVLIANIAKALRVSTDYLLGLTNMPTSKDVLSDEDNILLSVTTKISDDDKKVLWALLDKYLTPADRNLLNSINKNE